MNKQTLRVETIIFWTDNTTIILKNMRISYGSFVHTENKINDGQSHECTNLSARDGGDDLASGRFY